MEDLISRQAVLECFKKWQPYMATRIYEYEQELNGLPSVTPKPKMGRWIPVSERLPEESLNSVIGWDAYRERCVFVQYTDGHFQITAMYKMPL